jgi:hypothetical protein
MMVATALRVEVLNSSAIRYIWRDVQLNTDSRQPLDKISAEV